MLVVTNTLSSSVALTCSYNIMGARHLVRVAYLEYGCFALKVCCFYLEVFCLRHCLKNTTDQLIEHNCKVC